MQRLIEHAMLEVSATRARAHEENQAHEATKKENAHVKIELVSLMNQLEVTRHWWRVGRG